MFAKTRGTRLCTLFLIVLSCFLADRCSFAGDENARVHTTARNLMDSYKQEGWKYVGSAPNAKRRESNCSEFVVEVFRRLGIHDKTFHKRAAINVGIGSADDLADAIKKRLDVIRGPEYALTASGLGVAVAPQEAKTGDFIQYWIRQSGHTGVLVDPEFDGKFLRFSLIGMHAGSNINKVVGPGIISLSLNMDDDDIRVFIGRYTAK